MSNALASEKSPYLLQHASNPVAWLPWGEAAFAKAREEQKPIFLSIGYSTCHWCHVMAHESFVDAAVAEVLNTFFIPVKVDREERPDVDAVYMAYVQALTGHGGWPLSVWLTPDLKPFYGGTYFPPADRPGRHGLMTVLQALAEGWAHEREKLVEESERILGLLRERVPGQAGLGMIDETALTDAAGEAFERCFQQLFESFDPTNGGFGGAPKFPRASSLHFLSRCAAIQGSDTAAGREATEMAATTLARMAVGGIHDVIGGGYHRYSVDETWFVPHFEKMLYDQAQITVNALDVFKATGREIYAWMARDILDYVLRDLTAPSGGFYSAEDADSPVAGGDSAHAEGAFYVWTRTEIDSVLGAGAAFFCDLFDVQAGGNVPKELDPQGEFVGKNILRQKRPLGEVAAEHGMPAADASDALVGMLERLRAVRAGRARPHLDDKIITAWNGLMISALARASTTPAESLSDKRAFYREAAEGAARFVLRELRDPASGVLYRSFRDGRGAAEGFAEDYACLVAGLLDLHEATLDIGWLKEAETLQATMDARFWDATGGGYFNSDAGDASIVVRLKDDYDGAEPAPNSLAATNLMRLHALLGGVERREKALRTVVALQAVWSKTPQALPELLCALEWTLAEARHVVIAGDPATKAFQDLVAVVHERSGALRVVLAADGGAGQAWLAERAPWIAGMAPLGGRPAAYVCERFSCQAPVTTVGELRGRLR